MKEYLEIPGELDGRTVKGRLGSVIEMMHSVLRPAGVKGADEKGGGARPGGLSRRATASQE
jgi:hypothetical protein